MPINPELLTRTAEELSKAINEGGELKQAKVALIHSLNLYMARATMSSFMGTSNVLVNIVSNLIIGAPKDPEGIILDAFNQGFIIGDAYARAEVEISALEKMNS